MDIYPGFIQVSFVFEMLILLVTMHPTLDVLVSTGRDGTARVWDMRTRAQVVH